MTNAAERRNYVRNALQEKGHVTVSDLSDVLDVSEVTIRKDLRYLEEHNILLRTHGGAILPDRFVPDRPFEEKTKRNAEEKNQIGKMAASLVDHRDTIMLDAGTTTVQVARHLRGKRDLVVVTNAINVALELISLSDIETIILGGMIRPTSASVVGPIAESMIENQACQKLFLGVDGFDIEHGLTTTNPLEAHINRLMIDAAEQTIVVTDSTKFGRRGLSRICEVDAIHTVVTDDNITDAVRSALKRKGIRVLIP